LLSMAEFEQYHSKRNFQNTAEPSGIKPGTARPLIVVQGRVYYTLYDQFRVINAIFTASQSFDFISNNKALS